MTLTININDAVYVRLTEAGRNSLLNYWATYPDPNKSPNQKADTCQPGWRHERNWVRFQLWELMAIFGKKASSGEEFVKNQVRIGDQ